MVAVATVGSEGRPRPEPQGRRTLAFAVVIDVFTFVLACVITGAIVLSWLLIRTDAGAVDVSRDEAALALSFAAAILPAWTAWQCAALVREGATFGGRRARAANPIAMAVWRRALWLALHPVATPAWGWLAGTLALATMDLVAYFALGVSVAVAALSLASLVLMLGWPGAAPLHVRLATLRAGRGA